MKGGGEGGGGTQQLAKVFGRRLGFMRLNFTPYCIAGVPVGGLETISDVFSYSAPVPTPPLTLFTTPSLSLSLSTWGNPMPSQVASA